MIEIKKFNWVEGASALEFFRIFKYTGPTILGKQADVELIYKNKKSYRIYGDEHEVFNEAIARISKKTNQREREILIKSFHSSWKVSTVYGYSEYKKLNVNKKTF